MSNEDFFENLLAIAFNESYYAAKLKMANPIKTLELRLKGVNC